MMKKLAAVIAAITVCVLFAVNAAAVPSGAEGGACTLVQTSYADKGGNFTVDVVLGNNPGIKSLNLVIRIDYNDIDFVSVSDAGKMKGFYYLDQGGTVELTWTGSGNFTDNGTLATITFKALTDSSNGSVVSTAVTAFGTDGIRKDVEGYTAMIQFGASRNQPEVTEPAVTEPAATTASDEMTEEAVDDQTEATEATEATTEATEPTTEPTTTEPTTEPTTESTTTKKTTEKTTEKTTKKTTEKTTTPAPTTTTAPTTTEPPTTPTEPPTLPSVPETTPTVPTAPTEAVTEPSASEEMALISSDEAFSDVYNDGVDNKSANNGTLLIALIMIALTAVVVVAIEVTKRNR